MNLDHLKTFVAVYRASGFAPVAEFGVAPPSTTRTVAALEGELATRLFQHTTRKLITTRLTGACAPNGHTFSATR